MKRLFSLFLFATLLSATTYTTSFPNTENPISQNGNWINGGQSPALNWTNCRTTPGLAFGTENINSGTDDDSTCILTGTWGLNQTVTATVHAVGNYALGLEAELRLRTMMASHSITGYEIDCTPGIILIVRWNGAINNFTVLAQETNRPIQNDDTLVASIVGNTITVNINGTQVLQATDPSAFTNGTPGMGFFDRLDTTASDMGFTSFTATDGVNSLPNATSTPQPPSSLSILIFLFKGLMWIL